MTGRVVANNAGFTTTEHEAATTSLGLPPTATIVEIAEAYNVRNADIAESLGLSRDASYDKIKSASDVQNAKFVNSLLGKGTVAEGGIPTAEELAKAQDALLMFRMPNSSTIILTKAPY